MKRSMGQSQVRAYEKQGRRIPFNEIAQQAFDDGADYFVRVNDVWSQAICGCL